MTNQDVWRIALQQSAWDCGCRPEDFLGSRPVIVRSEARPQARKYLPLPFACDMVSYGGNVVAQTSPELAHVAEDFLRRYPPEHCFETPNLLALEDALEPYGLRVCFMAEYFLPDPDRMRELPCRYPLRLLGPEDFAGLYLPEWSNALCEKRKHLDVLAVGAYDGDTLIGMAGCSADCDSMYQIGVDVLPAYRRQGVAAALTSRLAREILKLDKVPFYCAAWCNLKSVGNALKCGFRPAWVELTARERSLAEQLNGTAAQKALVPGLPTLDTRRLTLRPFVPADLPQLQAILGDEAVMEQLEPPYSPEKTAAFLRSFCIQEQKALAAVRKEDGLLIGYLLFKPLGGAYELGWIFRRDCWRKGYASEGLTALIGWAFGPGGAEKLFAETIDPVRSGSLAEKLGMVREGVQRGQAQDSRGRRRDLYLYGLTKEDWETSGGSTR